MALEYPANKTVEKHYCKIRHKGKDNKSGVGLSTKSNVTCHNCGERGHLKSNRKSNRNGSNGDLSKASTRKLPKWVTKKPMISDVQNLTTATMNCNKHHYKWCTSCNDGDGAWGYHWKADQREWKEKQVKNKLVQFSYSATNAVIYCSYLIPPVRIMWRNKARWCGTGSCLRGKDIGVKVWGQAPTSVTVNYSKLILVPYHKPLDPMMDLYYGHKIDLKTRVYIWMRMDVIPAA